MFFFLLTVFYLLLHVIPLLCPGCCYSTMSGSPLAAPAVFQLLFFCSYNYVQRPEQCDTCHLHI